MDENGFWERARFCVQHGRCLAGSRPTLEGDLPGCALLLSPQMRFECVGDVPNVVFMCAARGDLPSQRMALYGAGDTVVAMAFTKVDELLQFVKDTAI